ncbi:ABC transporter ATP-binding protein [Clostridium autoethanogenum]|uniref:ABC transporter ATP-binding protein n=1 Tax=Clostridium autoethanogenum DSM 10061 TaxID=1341692 RepID=A0ABN4BE85_9CLOT|nr:ABC transporter ATP-binding protein [Clostridium autoethanogenum]AGY75662.1 ABC transporter ATP-binding protein [Clostridium autoethanogenum DSM 10061]ALU35826.1 ABC-type transporter related protein [Clostridium autoethanogenum DSM 10061]OVY52115.1 ABC transporter ATP-binding protein YtrB [Clostridium autoethanogenum]
MDEAISVRGLNKTYKNFSLKNVSFSVPKGSIVGFIGENGAGKTTTLKAILNLISRESGEIKILGRDNIKDEKYIKEQIGVVFDESNFHDTLNAKNISKFMAKIYKQWDSNLFFNYLDKFQVPKDKIVKEFSRGMKMKLCIAVALAHNPKLLILDEATGGLDPVAREEILDIFLDFIQDEEHSILLSSHVTSDLDKIADYITFIHEGQIVFSKSKDDLRENMGMLKCGASDFNNLSKEEFINYRKNQFGYEVLINDKYDFIKKHPKLVVDNTSIEDVMLFYIRGDK